MLEGLAGLGRKHKVDFVLCVGDVFDHTKPTQQVKDQLLKFVVENEHINFIFTVGNHDYVDKARSYHSLEYLKILEKKIDNVSVHEEGFYTEAHHGIDLLVIPETFDLEEIEFIRSDLFCGVGNERKKSKGKRPLIVACHGTVPGYEVVGGNATKASKGFCKELQEELDATYIALGDIHKRVTFSGKCFYPGALVQKTFSCEDGVLLVDIDGVDVQTEWLYLGLPKKVTLNIEVDENGVTEAEIVSFVKDEIKDTCFLKLKFSLPQTIYASLDKEQIRNELKGKVESVIFDNDPIVEKRSRVGIEKIAKAKSVEEEIYITVDEDDTILDKKILKRVCSKYL